MESNPFTPQSSSADLKEEIAFCRMRKVVGVEFRGIYQKVGGLARLTGFATGTAIRTATVRLPIIQDDQAGGRLHKTRQRLWSTADSTRTRGSLLKRNLR